MPALYLFIHFLWFLHWFASFVLALYKLAKKKKSLIFIWMQPFLIWLFLFWEIQYWFKLFGIMIFIESFVPCFPPPLPPFANFTSLSKCEECSSVEECLPSMEEELGSPHPDLHEWNEVSTCSFSIGESKGRGRSVQGHLWRHSKFEDSVICTRHCLIEEKNITNATWLTLVGTFTF